MGDQGELDFALPCTSWEFRGEFDHGNKCTSGGEKLFECCSSNFSSTVSADFLGEVTRDMVSNIGRNLLIFPIYHLSL